MWRGAVLLIAFVVLLGFASGGQPPAAAQGSVTWKACGGGFECATLDVPLDYTKPAARTIELALVRLPATKPAERQGILLANPGGPGASGIEFTRSWARALDSGIRERFDIIGWDPRGIGASTPLDCHENLQALIAADPTPDTEEEWDAMVAENRAMAAECERESGALLPHLGTKNVARDMDAIRAALGEERLNYIGYSYGTVIGQAYAELFPKRIRAMVLDGAVDLALSPDDRNRTQAEGFERALNSFIADCEENDCALTKRGGAGAAIDEVVARAEAAPIPSRSADRPAGPGEVLYGLASPLYTRQRWPELVRAIEAALDGDGSRLVRLTDDYLNRGPNGYDNSTETNTAVNCVDQPATPAVTNFTSYRTAAREFANVAPRFGPAFASFIGCTVWPARPDPLTAPNAADAPPILVISTSGDPATPYEWGVAVSLQLAGARLLSFGGEGHTAYLRGDSCIDGAVNRYLLELTLPPVGKVCGDAGAVKAPAPPTEAPGAAATDSTVTPEGGAETGGVAAEAGGRPRWFWVGLGSALAVVFLAAAGATAILRARGPSARP